MSKSASAGGVQLTWQRLSGCRNVCLRMCLQICMFGTMSYDMNMRMNTFVELPTCSATFTWMSAELSGHVPSVCVSAAMSNDMKMQMSTFVELPTCSATFTLMSARLSAHVPSVCASVAMNYDMNMQMSTRVELPTCSATFTWMSARLSAHVPVCLRAPPLVCIRKVQTKCNGYRNLQDMVDMGGDLKPHLSPRQLASAKASCQNGSFRLTQKNAGYMQHESPFP